MAKKVSKKATKQTQLKNNFLYEMKVTLEETSPPVSRTFLVQNQTSLSQLHILIQKCMGWENYHLYEFQIADRKYTDQESAMEMGSLCADDISIVQALDGETNFSYIYDYGDYWVHQLKVIKTAELVPGQHYPLCIAGENACPPEDCGGPGGFEEFKTALAGKNNSNKAKLLAWAGGFYNPSSFDPNFVNRYLLGRPR